MTGDSDGFGDGAIPKSIILALITFPRGRLGMDGAALAHRMFVALDTASSGSLEARCSLKDWPRDSDVMAMR